jgi:hypothetical protein
VAARKLRRCTNGFALHAAPYSPTAITDERRLSL